MNQKCINIILRPVYKGAVLLAILPLLDSCKIMPNDETESAMSYELMTVTKSNHELSVEYAAQIRGLQDVRIIPRVDGYLQEVKIKEGDKVKKGQLLFIIDQAAYNAALKTNQAVLIQAEARVSKAEQDLKGKQVLYEKSLVSDFDLQQTELDLKVANADLEAARASVESAKNDLSFTELRSPTDGVVGKIPYRKGDYVSPNMQDGLTIVSDNRNMYIYFSMTEQKVMDYLLEYGSMQEAIDNMPELSLVLPGGNIYPYKGRVESVSGIVDDMTGAVSVRAMFPNENGILLSGGTARVRMKSVMKDVIAIPQEATFELLDKTYVYKVVDGHAVSAIIETQRLNDGQFFVVKDGLNENDVIISTGAGLVREGAEVSTSEE